MKEGFLYKISELCKELAKTTDDNEIIRIKSSIENYKKMYKKASDLPRGK
jgi:hypothetical protein